MKLNLNDIRGMFENESNARIKYFIDTDFMCLPVEKLSRNQGCVSRQILIQISKVVLKP